MLPPHRQPPRTKPDPGYQICPECGGGRACWLCKGEGIYDGARCTQCLGRKYCIACDGAGQIPAHVKT